MSRSVQALIVTKDTTLDAVLTFLDDKVDVFKIKADNDGQHLYRLVFEKLGNFDSKYFGLAYLDIESNHRWLNRSQSLLKLARSLNRTSLEFFFSVKYYIPHPNLLLDDFARYLFALQIKRDFFRGILHSNRNTSLLLASFIVQSELGDYTETEGKSFAYLRKHHLLQAAPDPYLMRVMELHQKMIGLNKVDADRCLLDAARKMELYGVRLHPVMDTRGQACNLGVTYAGILVFQNFIRVNGIGWSKVRKLSFRRRNFVIKLHPNEKDDSENVEYQFATLKSCKNFWRKCIEQHSFFRSSASPFLSTDKHRSLGHLTSHRTASFPSTEWLRRSVSCEGSEATSCPLSSSQQNVYTPASSGQLNESLTSQTSTPLKRLARFKHFRPSWKRTSQTQNGSANNVNELQTSKSDSPKSSLVAPDFPYPTRKSSLPARPIKVTRLLSSNSELNAEHFQLLRLSLSSLLTESQSSLQQTTPTLTRRRTRGLVQQDRAISTPAISHTCQSKTSCGLHSFVPRCYGLVESSSITRSKSPSYTGVFHSSESASFPQRPESRQSEEDTGGATLPLCSSAVQVNAVQNKDEQVTDHNPTPSSFSPHSNGSPRPVSPSSNITAIVAENSAPEGEKQEQFWISDEARAQTDRYPLPLSVIDHSVSCTLDESMTILSPQLVVLQERSESVLSNEECRIDTSSTVDGPLDRSSPSPVTEKLLRNVNLVDCISLTSTDEEVQLHQQFKISQADSETLLVTHAYESHADLIASDNGEVANSNVMDLEFQSCLAADSDANISQPPSDLSETQPSAISARSQSPDQPMEVTASDEGGVCDVISGSISVTNQPTSTASKNSNNQLSMSEALPCSDDIASNEEAPESLADITSFGAISMLTGISCYDDDRDDPVCSCGGESPPLMDLEYGLRCSLPAVKLHPRLKQLGRGYWGASETSSESMESTKFHSKVKLLSRAKSDSFVHQTNGKKRQSLNQKHLIRIAQRNQTSAYPPEVSPTSAPLKSGGTLRSQHPHPPPPIDEVSVFRQMKMFLQSERLYQQQLLQLQSYPLEISEAYNCNILTTWLKANLLPLLQPLVERHGDFLNSLESNLCAWMAVSPDIDLDHSTNKCQQTATGHALAALSDEDMVDGKSVHSLFESGLKLSDAVSGDTCTYLSLHASQSCFSESDNTELSGTHRRQSLPHGVGQTFMQYLDILELHKAWMSRCPELISELWLMAYFDFLHLQQYAPEVQLPLFEEPSKKRSTSNEPLVCLSMSSISDVYESIEEDLQGPRSVRDVWQRVECSEHWVRPLLTCFLQPGRRLRQYCLQIGGLLAQYNPQHPDISACKIAFSQVIQYARSLYPEYIKAEQLAFTLQAARWVLPIGYFLGIHPEAPEDATQLNLITSSVIASLSKLHRFGWLKKYSRRGFQSRMVFLFDDRLIYASRIRDLGTVCLKVHGEIHLRCACVTPGETAPLRHFRYQADTPSLVAGSSFSSLGNSTFSESNLFAITVKVTASTDSSLSYKTAHSAQLSERFCRRRRRIVFRAPSVAIRNAWLEDLNTVINECTDNSESWKATGPSSKGIYRPQEPLETDMLRMQLSQRFHRCRSGGSCAAGKRPGHSIKSSVCRTNLLHLCWRRHLSFSHKQLLNAIDCELHGYLFRKLQQGSGWQKFWALLSDYCLYFYKSPIERHPQATIALHGYCVRILDSLYSSGPTRPRQKSDNREPVDERILEISFGPKRHLFHAESDRELMSWFHALSAVLSCVPTKSPSIPDMPKDSCATEQISEICGDGMQTDPTCSPFHTDEE
ncbi:unnamed protein product [Dicrocoelium dendriticum]|nr:unnamed protein product [Dicrocoelium dendriticum]